MLRIGRSLDRQLEKKQVERDREPALNKRRKQ
jgi:hypothetical protein